MTVVRRELLVAALAREENPAIVVDFRTMASQLHDSLLRERLMAALSGFFGGLAALIAAIGLYGVMSYTVARRRNDEPCKGALHDPAPPTQATHTIPKHTVRALPRSPAFAAQRGNRVHQRQGFLRVVPIRTGQTHGERHASPVANQMALAPALGPIGRVRSSLVTAMHRADGTTVHDRSRPINLIASSEPIQQREVNEIPHAHSLPIAQAAPTRHPRPVPEFLRKHVPGNAAAEDKQNTRETHAIGDARPSAFRPTRWSWQER